MAGATLFLPGLLSAAPEGKKTFTLLHTNDLHSSFIGMGLASDYTPFTPNDDATRGGYARLAALKRLVEKGKDGRCSDGDDARVAGVPGVDVVVGGHSHTELGEPILVNGRTPVVQTGLEGRNLGELVVTVDGGKLTVESCRLYPVDDGIAGDRAVADEIEKLKKSLTAAVFASRGYSVDQPLAVAPRDLPNTFTDIAAGTPLANLVTDALRGATKADIGFTAKGMMLPRASGMRFRYAPSRPRFDVVTVVELGDLDRGYRPVDITGTDARLHSLTCP